MKANRYYPQIGKEGMKWYPEDIVGLDGMTAGDYFFVDAAKSTGGAGKSWEDAFSDLDDAFLAVGNGDTIYMAPGTYTGNYSTPDETEAQNVSVIGVSPGMPGIRGGVNLAPTTSSSPIITNNASGWRYSNLCFRPGATSSGITLVADQNTSAYVAGTAGSISQGVTIDNCMFWGGGTGKYGIIAAGLTDYNGIHFANIINNHFQYLNAAGATAIWAAAAGNPNIGWTIAGNMFESNRAGIDTYANMGWVGSRIIGNTFSHYGVYATTEVLCDVTSTATPEVTGGNHFYNNGLGITIAEAAAGNYVLLNGYDYAGGNYCSDGMDTGIYKAS